MTKPTIYHFRTIDDYSQKGDGVPPSYSNVCSGFVNFTTAHGIPHISKTRGRIKPFVWSLNVLASLAGFTYMFIMLVTSFLDYNVNTGVTLIHNSTMSFPAVTVCNTNPIKSTNVKNEPRLVALLASWGIYINESNSSGADKKRKKRDAVKLENLLRSDKIQDSGAPIKKRSKRSSTIDHKNCHSGSVVNGGSYFTMTVGTDPPAWPAAGFCQLVWIETKATTYNYTVEIYPGTHPGIMFNWQDYQNYDFVYIRPGHLSSCVPYGKVVAGTMTLTGPGSSCGPFGFGKWNFITVAVTPTSVQIYSNGVKYESPWTPQFSSGYLGGATPNGYNDVIKYKNFRLIEDSGVIHINEGCKFKKFKTQSEGVASFCSNSVSKSTAITTESCIAEACAAGTAVNAVNIIVGTSCFIQQCATPMSEANLLLAASSSAPTGRDVWVRDFDDCLSAPCKNGGNCTDELFNYTCMCTDTGFTGPTCEININDCSPDPCQNGGRCADGVKSYTCSCAAGLTGTICETNLDNCTPDPCQNGGSCSDGTNTYTCSCAAGYTGTTCLVNINDCSPDPCQNGGTCADSVNSYTCSCAAGLTGTICETNIDDCTPNPCQNGGSCSDGINTYTCSCATGYTGYTCLVSCTYVYNDSCYHFTPSGRVKWSEARLDCQSRGMRLVSLETGDEFTYFAAILKQDFFTRKFWLSGNGNMYNGFNWTYPDGTIHAIEYSGGVIPWIPPEPNNDRFEKYCIQIGNNGNGEIGFGDNVCEHDTWKYSIVCEAHTHNNCSNGGTGVYVASEMECVCGPGYYGDSCQSCKGCNCYDCYNDGTCSKDPDWICNCSPGYYGTQCDQCKGCNCYDCYNGGACSKDPDWTCNCPPGYYGTQCEQCKGYCQHILTWTADSTAKLLADGTEIAYSDNATEIKSTRIPCNANVLGLVLTINRAASVYGFLGSYSTGLYTGTDSFRCTSISPSNNNWKYYGYDDSSWPYAHKYKQNIETNTDHVREINSAAYWIGTSDNKDTVYCRQVACPSPLTISIACDDYGSAYVDGTKLFDYSYYSKKTAIVPCNTEVVSFDCTNNNGDYGLTASLSSGWRSGIDPLICASSVNTGWKLKGYDDSSWSVPIHINQWSYLKDNNTDPSAKVIWLSGSPKYIYCRFVMCERAFTVAARGDDMVQIVIDGVLKKTSSGYKDVIQVHANCDSKVVGFIATDTNNGNRHFVGSVGPGDFAVTGGDNMRCLSSDNVTGNDWKFEGFNDSSWEVPMASYSTGYYVSTEYISPNAEKVWLKNNPSIIFCRAVLPSAVTVSAETPCPTKMNKTTTELNMTTTTIITDSPVNYTTMSTKTVTDPPETTVPNSDIPPVVSTSVPVIPPNYTIDVPSGLIPGFPMNPQLNFDVDKLLAANDLDNMKQVLSQYEERNEAPLTDEFTRRETLFKILAEIDDDTKKSLGYEINEMIYNCLMNGKICPKEDFTWFFDAVYGNCYVFNANWENHNRPLYISHRPGPQHGLRLNIDIGQYSYLPQIGESAGIVVVVHEPDKMPFPEDEGVMAMPGKEIHIGLKRIEILRKPHPYGDCRLNSATNHSENVYVEKYPVSYSSQTCEKTCYQKEVVDKCKCGDPQYPIKGVAFGNNTAACDIRDRVQDDCKYEVARKYANNELNCDCRNPCNEVTYKYSISGMLNPSERHGKFIEYLMYDKAPFLRNFDTNDYRRNVLTLKVYYEEFNYQRIEEYAAYSGFKLFTDINGIIGLWIGCTCFTVIELVELAMDFIVLFIYRKSKKHYWARTCCPSVVNLEEDATEDVPDENEVICDSGSMQGLNDMQKAPDPVDEVSDLKSEISDTGFISPTMVSITNTDIKSDYDCFQSIPLKQSASRNKLKTRKRKTGKRVKVAPVLENSCGSCDHSYWR